MLTPGSLQAAGVLPCADIPAREPAGFICRRARKKPAALASQKRPVSSSTLLQSNGPEERSGYFPPIQRPTDVMEENRCDHLRRGRKGRARVGRLAVGSRRQFGKKLVELFGLTRKSLHEGDHVVLFLRGQIELFHVGVKSRVGSSTLIIMVDNLLQAWRGCRRACTVRCARRRAPSAS